MPPLGWHTLVARHPACGRGTGMLAGVHQERTYRGRPGHSKTQINSLTPLSRHFCVDPGACFILVGLFVCTLNQVSYPPTINTISAKSHKDYYFIEHFLMPLNWDSIVSSSPLHCFLNVELSEIVTLSFIFIVINSNPFISLSYEEEQLK